MDATQNTGRTGITGDDDDGGVGLDPRQAAALIEQTARHARRQFASPPQAAVLGAGVFLFGYGAVWWSMRDQHTYTGPAGWSIAVLYTLIALMGIVGRQLLHRATLGIGGRARHQIQAQAAAVAAAGIAAWTVQGALRYRGVSFEVIYGLYGPTVPLIAIAAATTGFAASRRKWPELTLAIAVMLIAAGSIFFGPKGAWGLTGLGCAIALLSYAAALSRALQRPVRL